MKEKTKKIVKTIAPIVLILLAVLILGTGCWYTIGEQEQAVLTTLGKAEAITSPGLHFKIPLIQNVEKVNSEIHGMEIG